MWLEFKEKMEPFRVFSTRDINKMFPQMNKMNLVRWQKKEYLTKIINGWYCFNQTYENENIVWLTANRVRQPSYISLHTALSYYSIIPEAVYTTTSVTTNKTVHYNTHPGNFSYHSISPGLYGFGQKLIDYSGKSSDATILPRKLLIAEPEKAVLDFFYLFPYYRSEKELRDLRFDPETISGMNNEKLYQYLDRFENKALNNRIFTLIKVYSLM